MPLCDVIPNIMRLISQPFKQTYIQPVHFHRQHDHANTTALWPRGHSGGVATVAKQILGSASITVRYRERYRWVYRQIYTQVPVH